MQNDILNSDTDTIETQEWLAALASVIKYEGKERAIFLLKQLINKAKNKGINIGIGATTSYVNTIQVATQPEFTGDIELETKLTALMRWNAIAMVLRAGKKSSELGGHLATYASAATLYETGFNHFFHAASENHGGDLIFVQGHSSPGIYARAFLEGRLTEDQLDHFRQEIAGKGLSSYPHPWLMPEFWQFPTVSMGLGPLQAIYQARFLKYLQYRKLLNTENRKVWMFCGDGEMDEPESLGALTVAAREGLDNLIFVINCNLQRLDGPVRGNSKIVQELEGIFCGAGWYVIKVLWGSNWDALLAQDKKGLLQKALMETIDGEYQNFIAKDGAYIRENFFGKYPELKVMVEHLSDEEIWHLTRGGHDIYKVYSAYKAATEYKGQPTVILAKTVKGYGMGAAGEGLNITHQQKKMTTEQLKVYRDRFNLPFNDEEIEKIPYYRPAENSAEMQYLQAKRKVLGGYLPARRKNAAENLIVPKLAAFAAQLESSGERELSTTMAYVRILNTIVKDKQIGSRVVPIVPDESRTFGMEGMFRQIRHLFLARTTLSPS